MLLISGKKISFRFDSEHAEDRHWYVGHGVGKLTKEQEAAIPDCDLGVYHICLEWDRDKHQKVFSDVGFNYQWPDVITSAEDTPKGWLFACREDILIDDGKQAEDYWEALAKMMHGSPCGPFKAGQLVSVKVIHADVENNPAPRWHEAEIVAGPCPDTWEYQVRYTKRTQWGCEDNVSESRIFAGTEMSKENEIDYNVPIPPPGILPKLFLCPRTECEDPIRKQVTAMVKQGRCHQGMHFKSGTCPVCGFCTRSYEHADNMREP